MKRVVINKKQWLRGDNLNSQLLRMPDDKMCCIGFLARRLGCKRSEITGIGTLHNVANSAASEFDSDYSEELEDAYETNDDPGLSEVERIKRLRAIGERMGVRFIFK